MAARRASGGWSCLRALHAALGWLLDHSVLVQIQGIDKVPRQVLQLMESDPLSLLDSNWIVSDGFETIGKPVPEVHRAGLPGGRSRPSPAVLGRVTLTFTEHSPPRPKEIVKYENWPTTRPLSDWLPDEAKPLVAKYNNVLAAAADQHPPKLFVPMAGGAAIEQLDDVVMQASSEERIIAYRYTEYPNPKYARIVDVTCNPMKAVRCFSEAQLKAVAKDAATLAEVEKLPSKRLQLVNEHALYPAINGTFPVKLQLHQLLEKVLIVPPVVGLEAALIQSTSSFFVADHAIGAGGRLLTMRAMAFDAAESVARQIFVPNHAALRPVVHAAIQDAIIAKVKAGKRACEGFQ